MDELLDAEALSASSERVGIRTLVHVHLTQELLRMPPSVGSKAVTKKERVHTLAIKTSHFCTKGQVVEAESHTLLGLDDYHQQWIALS